MKSRLLWLTLAAAVVAAAIATWAAWIFLIAPIRTAIETGHKIQQEFASALNLTPRISAGRTVIFSPTSPTLELVTAERSSVERLRVEDTWLHSTKVFEVEAVFAAKAGFDLREPFSVNVLRGGRTAEIRLPKAQILSLGMSGLRVLADDDGIWNKISAQDREKAIGSLERQAKAEFLKTDLLATATREAEKRIREIAASAGCEAVFIPSLARER